MNRSLQTHLLRRLTLVIVVSGLLAAAAAFVLSYLEAREFQDDMLQQIAVLSTHHDPGSKTPALAVSDPESRVQIFHVPGQLLPDWLPADLAQGFHTLLTDNGEMRVCVVPAGAGAQTLAAQSTEVRNEIARDSALRTLLPVLLLLPLLLWLVIRILRTEFSGLDHLARGLDDQPAGWPQPLPEDGVPAEILPFVQAINRLLTRIAGLMQQQRRFVADAAHELRTPLTALQLQIQNLQQVQTPDVLAERLPALIDGVERARQLSGQLLGLARTQAGSAQPVKVDVSALALQLLAEFHPRAEAAGIDLGLDQHDRFMLLCAPESLSLILTNALDNALKYTPAGGSVTLSLQRQGNVASIEVLDTGPGIAASELPRVFDAFYRIPGSAGTGSGLGLAIASEAAERNHGHITLTDRSDGSGLLFRYEQACMDA